MKEEITTIEKNGTWKMVESEGKSAIDLKWVFKTKFVADGILEKYKARLVAKGYVQQHGSDFEKTFSSIAHFENVKIVLALAAQRQWSVYQFDVKLAFLHGELQEEVYVGQPEGFVIEGSKEKVYKLTKALYGFETYEKVLNILCVTLLEQCSMAFCTLNFPISSYAGSRTAIGRAHWMIGRVFQQMYSHSS